MRILYWDVFAGISGDMALGSLLALGADRENIVGQLRSMGLTEFELEVRTRLVQGIQATDIEVIIKEDTLEQRRIQEQRETDIKEDLHIHRSLQDIRRMILSGSLSAKAQNMALEVFSVLAEAEAQIHGTTAEQVHFHEVGAVDSLVDIVGTCIALDQLNVEKIMVSKLPWSRGFVRCSHGLLPLPAPATLLLLRGFTFYDSDITGELITPTGAALIRALGSQTPLPEMTLLQTGYGSGKNHYGVPELLRGVLGETELA